jgi:hypothetical protein
LNEAVGGTESETTEKVSLTTGTIESYITELPHKAKQFSRNFLLDERPMSRDAGAMGSIRGQAPQSFSPLTARSNLLSGWIIKFS